MLQSVQSTRCAAAGAVFTHKASGQEIVALSVHLKGYGVKEPDIGQRKHEAAGMLRQAGFHTDGQRTPTEPSSGRELDFITVRSHLPHQLKAVAAPSPYPQASDHTLRLTRLEF